MISYEVSGIVGISIVEVGVGMSSRLLVSIVGAVTGAMLAVFFSIRVFGIDSGGMYIAFIIALGIPGARLARVIYAKATKGK